MKALRNNAKPFNPAHALPLPPELLIAFAGLSGPIETFGTCLSAFEPGDLIWWDEREAPRSGDYVMIEMHPDRQAAWERKAGLTGEGPRRGIKRLEKSGDGEWLLFADDAPEGIPVSDHRILGPVVFRLQPVRKRGAFGTLERTRRRHADLRREIRYFEKIARTPAQREELRLQRFELQKIDAADRELEQAVYGEAPALPRAAGQPMTLRSERKVGRNDPCSCGSGKKFKHCHGALSAAGVHCNSLSFGPTTNLAVSDTAQIGDNAATTPKIATDAATEVYYSSLAGPQLVTADNVVLAVSTFTAAVACKVQAIATYDAHLASGSGVGNVQLFLFSTSGGTVGDSATFDATERRYTFSASINAAAGDSVQAQVKGFGATTNVTVTRLNLRTEVIKR